MINKLEKKECTGCHACLGICPKQCINMESDAEGFWYPVIDFRKCIKCNLCEKVCPSIIDFYSENTPQAYAAYNNNINIRLKSSSGGIFSLLAESVIEKEGVVFGAGFDDQFNVVHKCVDNSEDLEKLRGAKYVQSKIGDAYVQCKKYLDDEKNVLFSGTPCQIGGLYSFLGKDYNKLVTQDMICHGVPSPKLWSKYIEYQEKKYNSKLRYVDFRKKTKGWKNYCVELRFQNQNTYEMFYIQDLMMKIFLKNFYLRPSCYNCLFKNINRQADITLGDFWGIQYILPEMDDNQGTSLLIVNSVKGEKVFEEISKCIKYKKVEIDKAIQHNASMIKSSSLPLDREKFIRDVENKDFEKIAKKYCDLNLKQKIMKLIRRIIGKIYRIVRRKNNVH